MSEKPKKRLVSKGRYAWLMVKRTTLFSVSVCCFLFGAYWAFWLIAIPLVNLSHWTLHLNFLEIAILLIVGLISGLGFLLGTYFFKSERKVERVAPITKRTTSTLPHVESLLRPSDQQAELLRAAPQGSETPPEELLRASVPSESAGPADNE